MKKILYIILLTILVLSGCSSKDALNSYNGKALEAKAKEIVEVKENIFVTQCEDIHLNPDNYKGKTIKIEGMYDEYVQETTNETFTYIMRRSPGCCGDDGYTGFKIKYSGDMPSQDDWIEVIGELDLEEDNGIFSIIINASSVKILDTRGKEFVTQ